MDKIEIVIVTGMSGAGKTTAMAAFEKAWQHCKADCPEYFTLYKGKGSVGGEKK